MYKILAKTNGMQASPLRQDFGVTLRQDFGVSAQSNAERLALSIVEGSRSIDPNASGDSTATLAGAILLEQVESMNEESPRMNGRRVSKND